MTPGLARRGQPVLVMLALLAGWVLLRMAAWEAPAPGTFDYHHALPDMAVDPLAADPLPRRAALSPATPAAGRAGHRPLPQSPVQPLPLPSAPAMMPLPGGNPAAPPPAAQPVPARIAAGHVMLLMAVFSQMPEPASLLPPPGLAAPPSRPVSVPEVAKAPARRWSGDGWLLLRRGGLAGPAAPSSPTYGASQAGAVIRYRLDPASGHRPALFVRATAALNRSRERDLAGGIVLRPVPGLPVAVAAEARISDSRAGTRTRPAAFAHSELAPIDLPGGWRAEAYGQAGLVGGKGGTAFADGQLRVDRAVAHFGPAELRAGGGAWAGAQEGVSRVDVAPGVTLGLPVGSAASARLALDWRFRVAGDARPESGPALTLSAGF